VNFVFKDHLWFPFFVKNRILEQDFVAKALATPNGLNCSATKNHYIIDFDKSEYRCRKLLQSKGNYLWSNPNRFGNSSFDLPKSSGCAECLFFNCCAGCPAISDALMGCCFLREKDCPFFYKHTLHASNE
jgi:hypothetical protein